MSNDYKKDSLYVFGVVCANGVEDSYGDVLDKQDIKKLMSSYTRYETDTNHNFLSNVGVSVVENYQTQQPLIVRGKDVPVGSWVQGLLIWDSKLKESILSEDLNGLSLSSRPDSPEVIREYMTKHGGRLSANYRDFEDKDDLKPLFVSLVDGAGNGYNLEYMPYAGYIERRKQEDNSMSENVEDYIKFTEAMFNFIERSNQGSKSETEEKDKVIRELQNELKEKEEEFNKQLALKDEENKKMDDRLANLEKSILEIQTNTQGEEGNQEGGEGNPEGEEGNQEGGEGNPAGEEGTFNPEKGMLDPSLTNTEGEKVPTINRRQQESLQGEHGKSNPSTVSNDKFFTDGYIPKQRGYNGLP